MWIAYLVSKHNYHLVVEDGLGYLAKGETKEIAEANVWVQFLRSFCDVQTDEDRKEVEEIYKEEYALHSQEL